MTNQEIFEYLKWNLHITVDEFCGPSRPIEIVLSLTNPETGKDEEISRTYSIYLRESK